MSLFKTTIALAGLALASAACSDDDKKTAEECQKKLTMPTDMTDKAKMCTYFQDVYKCAPDSCCSDDDIKKGIEKTEKDNPDCKIECGAGSMLAPGAAALAAAVVALKLM